MSNKNDARSNALEALHGIIESHRPLLDEAFAERGSMSLLPAPVRAAISAILVAADQCGARARPLAHNGEPGKENPLLVAEEGRGRID